MPTALLLRFIGIDDTQEIQLLVYKILLTKMQLECDLRPGSFKNQDSKTGGSELNNNT